MKKSTHAEIAARIRAELKAHKIAGRVRCHHDTVYVTTTDLAPWTAKAIASFAGQFELGRFDGMTDSYVYDNRRDDLPQIRYVFVENLCSEELRERIRAHQAAYWADWATCGSYEQDRRIQVAYTREDGGFWKKPRTRVAATTEGAV